MDMVSVAVLLGSQAFLHFQGGSFLKPVIYPLTYLNWIFDSIYLSNLFKPSSCEGGDGHSEVSVGRWQWNIIQNSWEQIHSEISGKGVVFSSSEWHWWYILASPNLNWILLLLMARRSPTTLRVAITLTSSTLPPVDYITIQDKQNKTRQTRKDKTTTLQVAITLTISTLPPMLLLTTSQYQHEKRHKK